LFVPDPKSALNFIPETGGLSDVLFPPSTDRLLRFKGDGLSGDAFVSDPLLFLNSDGMMENSVEMGTREAWYGCRCGVSC
jgi:hypothetical protein